MIYYVRYSIPKYAIVHTLYKVIFFCVFSLHSTNRFVYLPLCFQVLHFVTAHNWVSFCDAFMNVCLDVQLYPLLSKIV